MHAHCQGRQTRHSHVVGGCRRQRQQRVAQNNDFGMDKLRVKYVKSTETCCTILVRFTTIRIFFNRHMVVKKIQGVFENRGWMSFRSA